MTPRPRIAALLTALALAGLTPLATAPAQASAQASARATTPAPAKTLQLSNVRGHGTPADGGTAVHGSYVVKNRTGVRQPATKVWAFIAAPGRSYRLGTTTRTPALAPGQRATVGLGPILTPVRTIAGTYSLRICLTPRPDGPCATSVSKVVVEAAQLAADPAGPVDLGAAEAGAQGDAQLIAITNAGHARTNALAVDLYGPDLGDFVVDPGSCTGWLAPGDTCEAEVTFSPADGGPAGGRTAFLRVAGGPTDAVDVTLGGLVVAGQLSIVPGSHDYGDVPVGGASAFTYELHNSGTEDLPLTDGFIEPFDDFYFDQTPSENSCLSFVIPAEGFCTFSVTFGPTTTGALDSTVTFYSGDLVAVADLTGTGTPGVRPAQQSRSGSYLR